MTEENLQEALKSLKHSFASNQNVQTELKLKRTVLTMINLIK